MTQLFLGFIAQVTQQSQHSNTNTIINMTTKERLKYFLKRYFSIFFVLFFRLCYGMWALSALIKDQTLASCIGSAESWTAREVQKLFVLRTPPGGTVDKILPANAGSTDLLPGLRKFYSQGATAPMHRNC